MTDDVACVDGPGSSETGDADRLRDWFGRRGAFLNVTTGSDMSMYGTESVLETRMRYGIENDNGGVFSLLGSTSGYLIRDTNMLTQPGTDKCHIALSPTVFPITLH
jgi:hypothetical protein